MRHILIALFVSATFSGSLSAFDVSSLFGGDDKKKAAESTATSAADLQKLLGSSIDKAKSSFSDNPEMVSRLSNIAKESAKGEDMSMVQNLAGLAGLGGADGMMTEGQKSLLAEVKGQAQALALTRNFSDDPAISGPVQNAVKAVQTRDAASAMASLKEISEKGSLSEFQKTMLTSMLGDYGSYLDKAGKAADAANQLKSLF
ncbi:hypothetical protein [Rubellicoccus peritrichatus]|uniref:DUF2780 domain-containing protein n=1 Tax=Rubellicoccus peritrichatus TaxID=3080537 RepID=A0AAQ3LC45_9BACT|nr:hypothetical protein [Puniceicoccus sp. CR14]WOO41829.1 hypothetical protein RZN69_01925 [Puniceicoccus sp. CR14]